MSKSPMSKLSHDDLVEIARKWLLKRQAPPKGSYEGGRAACSLVITDMTSGSRETPDAIGWAGWGHSTLVECKVSVEDFKRDQYKCFRQDPKTGAGVTRFYMAPEGLLSVDQLPESWGLIEVDDKGKTRVKKRSEIFETDRRGEIEMMLSLIRRLKVKPGKHVSIRAYTIEKETEPRATVTLVEDSEGEEQ